MSRDASGVQVGEKRQLHMLELHLIAGFELPKPNEQCCCAEVHDRYHPASTFGPRPSSASGVIQPAVIVEVHSGEGFRCAVAQGSPLSDGASFTSSSCPTGGLHAVWDERITCVAEQADGALVSFHVRGADKELLAYEALPMHTLREGYRAVRLRSLTGSRLMQGTLLVHLREVSLTVDAVTLQAQPKSRRRASTQLSPVLMQPVSSRLSSTVEEVLRHPD